MLTNARRLYRAMVDRIAEAPGLRGRAGADAKWAHYERHAKAWRRAAERHQAARHSAPARDWARPVTRRGGNGRTTISGE